MYEYIKKMSVSLCLLENFIKDIEIKKVLQELSMSLIRQAKSFLMVDGQTTTPDISNYFELRKLLVEIIDYLDWLRIRKSISHMNSEIITSASLKLIEEIDLRIHRLQSFTSPSFSLSEITGPLARDRARSVAQDKFSESKIPPKDLFRFTKIPEIAGAELEQPEEKKLKETTSFTEKADSNLSPSQPLVYTFFGSEDKIIAERKVKILEILKEGGGVPMGDICANFPDLNPKTIQRDLLELMREKKIIMMGKKRWAKYYLK